MDAQLLSHCRRSLGWQKYVRVRIDKEDDDPDVLQQCAILPCVEGQKFTIGKYPSEEEEPGEFIYYETKATKTESVCKIDVEDMKFFLTPSKGAKVWINEEPVLDRKELKFGDYLSLEEKEDVNPDATFVFIDMQPGQEKCKKPDHRFSLWEGDFLIWVAIVVMALSVAHAVWQNYK